MAWVILMVAGLLEIGWAVGLKYTDGFTRPLPSVLTGAAIVASMLLLSIAVRTLPIGTAYAVWVGIGAAGAAVLGIALFGEPSNPSRLFFLALLVVSIMGLMLSTPSDGARHARAFRGGGVRPAGPYVTDGAPSTQIGAMRSTRHQAPTAPNFRS
jgi:quaternary ammonium compound-resistance protein SugE